MPARKLISCRAGGSAELRIEQSQIGSVEQQVVLRTLAQAAGGEGCMLLEVGSWRGDSTVILAEVAKARAGLLVCVDWWRGTSGTILSEIASHQDVFGMFWGRITREGLDEVVVPVRARSETAAPLIKPGLFDLVFIDGDHSYEGTLKDIRDYAPLVRPDGGILAGHDCEGRVEDFDRRFLEAGKQKDIHETVHCGVVLAVGESFEEYSIDHSIWSVRAEGGRWAPTGLAFADIEAARQVPPPPIGHFPEHTVYRCGRKVYAVPNALRLPRICEESLQAHPEVTAADDVEGLSERIGEKMVFEDPPLLLCSGCEYNFVLYRGEVYALAQEVGQLDLTTATAEALAELRRQGKCFVGRSLTQAQLSAYEHAWKSRSEQLAAETARRRELEQLKSAMDGNRWCRFGRIIGLLKDPPGDDA